MDNYSYTPNMRDNYSTVGLTLSPFIQVIYACYKVINLIGLKM